MTDIDTELKDLLKQQFRDTYTMRFCIVDAIDRELYRVTVVDKDDENVLADNIPVATPFAGDGFGERYPIEVGETEGIVCSLKDPIDELLRQRGPVEGGISKQRQHSIEDAIFFPRIHFDPDEIPIVETLLEGMVGPTGFNLGEYLMWHPSDSWWRITDPESGGNIDIVHNGDHYIHMSDEVGIRIRHASGHQLHISESGVELRGPSTTTATAQAVDAQATSYDRVSVEDGTVVMQLSTGETVRADETGIRMERPDGGTILLGDPADFPESDSSDIIYLGPEQMAMQAETGVQIVNDGQEVRIDGPSSFGGSLSTESLSATNDVTAGNAVETDAVNSTNVSASDTVDADTASARSVNPTERIDNPPQDVRNITDPTAGDTAFHDGSGTDNTTGLAQFDGTDWVSILDNTVVS